MTDNAPAEIIGFIGLGTMGREMAINLMKAGHRVQAFDVRDEAVDELATLGAQACRSVAAAASGAAIAITMLPDTPDVERVAYGEGGLLAHPPTGRLVIDMSTIAPSAVRRMKRCRLRPAGGVCPDVATVPPFFPARPASADCDRTDRHAFPTAAKKSRQKRLTRDDKGAK